MADRYTKFILTVIAVALVGILCQDMVRPAKATPAECGDIMHACYIQTLNPLEVTVR